MHYVAQNIFQVLPRLFQTVHFALTFCSILLPDDINYSGPRKSGLENLELANVSSITMAPVPRNSFLDTGLSDESDHDEGYDSEAAEISKAGRASKRRKVEHEYTDEEEDEDEDDKLKTSDNERQTHKTELKPSTATVEVEYPTQEDDEIEDIDEQQDGDEDDTLATKRPSSRTKREPTFTSPTTSSAAKKKKSRPKKEHTPGVIYLSSLPPYLKPSALRNILEQRGFSPILQIFLSPASKSNKSHAAGGKNSRQLYTEGWIEFGSKKTAKLCAETLNASTVGGKKGGYYRDDVWNMKYLRGMRWEELMSGVREEKREMDGRRDEERRVIAKETRSFVEGVEEGRKLEGMRKKRERKKPRDDEDGEGDTALRRTWRQNEVHGNKNDQDAGKAKISDDVRQVLGKIF